ncbi:hypothetical protein [Micromonospora deserti]|uniref:hypothetical protein n=1 Tax=Micromonospora deserti TaxID=2070366 RepID=UPI0011B6ABA0|nr:hypothetical protein [Micromonospora deserti]
MERHVGTADPADVWLAREVRWHVVAEAVDSETGKVLQWEFDTEGEARQTVRRLVQADGGQWRERTGDRGDAPVELRRASRAAGGRAWRRYWHLHYRPSGL